MIGKLTMLPTHFITQLWGNDSGFSWTLTSRLGDILSKAETAYGPRDMNWTILGIEFCSDVPQIWFPGNCRHIAIQLATNALGDTAIACYQLAHEVIHLLAPNGQHIAPVIEEGLATVFSEDYLRDTFNKNGFTDLASYQSAGQKVRELLYLAPQAIRALRDVEPCFKSMTADTFVQAGLTSVPSTLIDELLLPFRRT